MRQWFTIVDKNQKKCKIGIGWQDGWTLEKPEKPKTKEEKRKEREQREREHKQLQKEREREKLRRLKEHERNKVKKEKENKKKGEILIIKEWKSLLYNKELAEKERLSKLRKFRFISGEQLI